MKDNTLYNQTSVEGLQVTVACKGDWLQFVIGNCSIPKWDYG